MIRIMFMLNHMCQSTIFVLIKNSEFLIYIFIHNYKIQIQWHNVYYIIHMLLWIHISWELFPFKLIYLYTYTLYVWTINKISFIFWNKKWLHLEKNNSFWYIKFERLQNNSFKLKMGIIIISLISDKKIRVLSDSNGFFRKSQLQNSISNWFDNYSKK